MSMHLEHLHDKNTGRMLAAVIVRNKAGKALAIGALSRPGHTFMVMCAPRYERDLPMVEAIERRYGVPVRRGESHGR